MATSWRTSTLTAAAALAAGCGGGGTGGAGRAREGIPTPIPIPVEVVRRIEIGQQVEDRLRSDDPRRATGAAAHTWHFAAAAGQPVVIEMIASFDALVVLEDAQGRELARDDDSGDGLNARLTYTLPATGEYRAVATSFAAARFGSYTLRVRAGVPERVREIAIGQEVADRLNSDDAQRNGRPSHVWTFRGTAGQRVQIDLVSEGLDPVVELEDSSGIQLGRDDDSGGSTNALLFHTLRYSGTYRLRATAFAAGATGRYTLRVAEAPAEVTRQIAVGQDVTDRLTPASPRMTGNRAYQVWLFDGRARQRVLIDMQSPTLDAHLILEDSAGTELTRDDDSGEGTNAAVDYVLPATGRYRIRANSYRANSFGEYTLRLAEPAPERVRTIALGQEVSDRLTSADPRIPTNRPYHAWLFSGPAGLFLTVEMRSSGIDAYLILQDSNGVELAHNDDGGEGNHARLNFTLPAGGTYRILANAYASNTFGEYTLRVRAGTLPSPLGDGVRGTITRGQTRSGALADSDALRTTPTFTRIIDGSGNIIRLEMRQRESRYVAYTYRARAGETLTIDLRSASLDMLLQVQEADGELLTSDDDGGEGLNSRLTVTFPYSGDFRIVVTTAAGTTTGPYELVLR
jgi:hypothetical protein